MTSMTSRERQGKSLLLKPLHSTFLVLTRTRCTAQLGVWSDAMLTIYIVKIYILIVLILYGHITGYYYMYIYVCYRVQLMWLCNTCTYIVIPLLPTHVYTFQIVLFMCLLIHAKLKHVAHTHHCTHITVTGGEGEG